METENELEEKDELDERLWDAIKRNDLDLAEQCIRLKADGRSALHIAALQSNVEAAKILLLNGANVNAKDYTGKSPLHMALVYGHTQLVELLIEKGADPNYIDDDGKSPLHMAVVGGHTQLVELLIEIGADIDHRDTDGRTPFEIAALYRHTQLVELLLEKGANIDNRDYNLNYMREAKRRRVQHESEPSFIRKTYSIGDTVCIRIQKSRQI